MRVMVTGASGFIGRRIVRELARESHQVFGVIRDPAHELGHATPVLWDLRGPHPAHLPRRLDAIVHAAQSRNYRSFPTHAADMVDVNVAGAAHVLQYATEVGVRTFCLVSSGTVYEPYCNALVEDAAVSPSSFLGATKLAAEVLARPYSTLFGVAVLRLFFPYGPGQEDRLIPNLLGRLRSGQAIELSSDGEGLRLVPTFVDDISVVVACALAEEWHGTINVATPRATTIRELAETIGYTIGVKPTFKRNDCTPVNIVPCLGQLRARFNVDRFTPLSEGIRQTVEAR
jgi:nucleoside-diphosphate-sugar epimerase